MAGNVQGRMPREAGKLSVLIDKELRNEAERWNGARKQEVKVLLLGQAESGKSTLRKQFQLLFAPGSLDIERVSWIPVVYLNVIKTLRTIFIELDYQLDIPKTDDLRFVEEIRQELTSLRVRLLPFMALESLLASEVNGGTTYAGGQPQPLVRHGWQSRIVPAWKLKCNFSQRTSRRWDLAVLGGRTLANVVDDIDKLWSHWVTRFYIKKRKIPLSDNASYFMGHIRRIGEPDYCPTNDDILHARLQTLGVVEYASPDILTGRRYAWKLYDVSGVRGQRRVWIPFFDDATAVIFLVAISAFDQYLEEDPSINRIQDSLHLWFNICSNRLLHNAHLVLFLNKIDLLKQKLDAGVSVQKYITSFGNRPNDFESAANFFRIHFERVGRRAAPNRPLYVHFTSLLDNKAMHSVISDVKVAIMKRHTKGMTLA